MNARDFAKRIEGAKCASNGQWQGKCPAHHDRKASLCWTDTEDKILVHCQAGCVVEAIVERLDLRMADLFFENLNGHGGNKKKKIVEIYEYVDGIGTLLFQVVRYDPKDFRQRHPDGNGGWIWNLNGVRRVLYRLPDILKAALDGRRIYLAEGEKDADRLAKCGLTATTCPMGAGKWREEYAESLKGVSEVILIPDNDGAGRKHAEDVAKTLHGHGIPVKVLRLPDLKEKEDVSDFLEGGGTVDILEALADECPPWEPSDDEEPSTNFAQAELPVIHVEGGQLPRMVNEAEASLLAGDCDIYQRANLLCRVVRNEKLETTRGIERQAGTLTIHPIEAAYIRERFTESAVFLKKDSRRKKPAPIDCPPSVASTYLARVGRWNVPYLTGIIQAPTIRPDGSILGQPGYDQQTGLLFVADFDFPPVPDIPTQADTREALETLMSPFSTIPFVSDADRSVFLASILTAIARHCFPTAPAFGITAPSPGTGKTMLVGCGSLITTGKEAPAMSQGKNPDDDRKRIFSALLCGDSILLMDNAERPVGGDALCAILTLPEYRDRLLTTNRMATVPTAITLFVTGNNLTFYGDMTNRALLCRLDAGVERPEEREFDVDLSKWVSDHRGELASAALTVLRAYYCAGMPKQDVKPFGQFQEWSNLIRNAVVWLGEPDPCETRETIRQGDPIQNELRAMVHAWHEAFEDEARTVKEAVAEATALDPPPERFAPLIDAMSDIAKEGKGKDKNIDTRKLGTWLARMKNRPLDGLAFVEDGTEARAIRWASRSPESESVSLNESKSLSPRQNCTSEGGKSVHLAHQDGKQTHTDSLTHICYVCKGTNFWETPNGDVKCARCHPPASGPGASDLPGGRHGA